MVRRSKEGGSANDGDAKERIRQAKKDVEQIRQSKYALGKNPENLTTKQRERLALIQAGDPQLMRGHAMKEKLRLIFKLTHPTLAEEELDGWLGWAQRCRHASCSPVFGPARGGSSRLLFSCSRLDHARRGPARK